MSTCGLCSWVRVWVFLLFFSLIITSYFNSICHPLSPVKCSVTFVNTRHLTRGGGGFVARCVVPFRHSTLILRLHESERPVLIWSRRSRVSLSHRKSVSSDFLKYLFVSSSFRPVSAVGRSASELDSKVENTSLLDLDFRSFPSTRRVFIVLSTNATTSRHPGPRFVTFALL